MEIRFKNIFFVAGLSSLVFMSACRKKIDTIAKVYVKDAYGVGVSDCQVILKGISTINKTSSLADTARTNSGGEAIFNFNEIYKSGQAGVAVLDVFASKNGVSGTGIIQIVEKTTSQATVVVQ